MKQSCSARYRLFIRPDDTVSVKFSRAELEAFHGAQVDDLVDDRVRLLFVGINPGLWTAAVNAHFARRGNRIWPALHAAGITPHVVDVSDGMSDADRELVLGLGIGITNIVPTASARAEELSLDELRAGAAVLESNVRRWKPKSSRCSVSRRTGKRSPSRRRPRAIRTTGSATRSCGFCRTRVASMPTRPSRPSPRRTDVLDAAGTDRTH
jgi:hypothetical protein